MKPVKKEKHTPKHYLPDTTPKIAAAGATVLVLLVVLSFVLSSGWMHGSSTGIILPGSEGDSPTVGTGSALLTGQSVDDITIDINNAKTVIATLARPTAYSSRIENTIYYDGARRLCTAIAMRGIMLCARIHSVVTIRCSLR